MGYNSRRRHYLLLLSTKNRELRFQFVRENWTMKTEKKLALSGEFQFQHLVGTVRIWCNQHENMTPSCFVSLVQTPWWCNGIGAIVLTHFGPFSTS